MYVKKLTWIGESKDSAELIVSDGQYDCVVFSHPCKFQEGDVIDRPLSSNNENEVMISFEKECFVRLLKPEGFAQNFVCEMIDLQLRLVKIGNIYITVELKIPVGIRVGDLVEFTSERLDIF